MNDCLFPHPSGRNSEGRISRSLGISQCAFARTIDVPPNRVNDIVRGKRSITGDMALRFSLALGTSPEMWLRLQAFYELEKARDEADPDLGEKIKRSRSEVRNKKKGATAVHLVVLAVSFKSAHYSIFNLFTGLNINYQRYKS